MKHAKRFFSTNVEKYIVDEVFEEHLASLVAMKAAGVNPATDAAFHRGKVDAKYKEHVYNVLHPTHDGVSKK